MVESITEALRIQYVKKPLMQEKKYLKTLYRAKHKLILRNIKENKHL